MKKWLCAIFVMVIAFAAVSCGMDSKEKETDTTHKIGVLVYNIGDEEVQAFKGYLDSYITTCFPDVQFVYSDSIQTPEEGVAFINDAAKDGVEGIMSFVSRDLEMEIQACEANKIYYMYASGLVPEEKFQAVADNPWFLGEVGPSQTQEVQAGYDMVTYFAEHNSGKNILLFSGGASAGNAMHLARFQGMLDALDKEAGLMFDLSTEEILAAQDVLTLQSGAYNVTIVPGYLSREDVYAKAEEIYQNGEFDIALSVLPVFGIADEMKGKTAFGVVDSYTERNQTLFNHSTLEYLVGKYSSMIGPSFAVIYNAVTGHAEQMKENGKAFKIEQGFWISDNREDFSQKYALATSLEINAYNYEDIQKVCIDFNPDASLDSIKKLASEYQYEDVMARRQLEIDKNGL